MKTQHSVYMDYSATTPTDPRVVDAMMPYFIEIFGNASSAHRFGRKAEAAVEQARVVVARILNCKPSEIVFTGSGSEGDNIAVRGAAWAMRQAGKGHHLITSPIEHGAIANTVNQLVNVMGFERTLVNVDNFGMVHTGNFALACKGGTTLASFMFANNEIGTINPIAELARISREKGVLFHTDAVQAAGQLSLDTKELGVDMLSVAAHKFYGPKGIGVLFVRDGVELITSQSGGSHENGRRAGTHNTALIVGLATALELAYMEREARIQHFSMLRDMLIEGVLRKIPNARLTGHPENRLPSHASFIFDGVESNTLLMHLDMKGVAASSGSACKTGNPEPSEVLLAMGYSKAEATSSLRLTLGLHTSLEDVEYTIDALVEVVEKLTKLKRELLS